VVTFPFAALPGPLFGEHSPVSTNSNVIICQAGFQKATVAVQIRPSALLLQIFNFLLGGMISAAPLFLFCSTECDGCSKKGRDDHHADDSFALHALLLCS
jgi:hypothetical protein